MMLQEINGKKKKKTPNARERLLLWFGHNNAAVMLLQPKNLAIVLPRG